MAHAKMKKQGKSPQRRQRRCGGTGGRRAGGAERPNRPARGETRHTPAEQPRPGPPRGRAGGCSSRPGTSGPTGRPGGSSPRGRAENGSSSPHREGATAAARGSQRPTGPGVAEGHSGGPRHRRAHRPSPAARAAAPAEPRAAPAAVPRPQPGADGKRHGPIHSPPRLLRGCSPSCITSGGEQSAGGGAAP